MKISYYLLIVAVFCISITGCEIKGDQHTVVNGTGPIVTDSLDFTSFDKIENTGVVNFYITIGSVQSIVLKAQQNIIDVMTYRVERETLKVGLMPNVSLQDFEEISFDIVISSINKIDHTGVGNFFLSGDDQASLAINLIGIGNVNSYDMRSDTCTIYSTGVGDCKVHVLDELDVTITGVGNIYYKGDPTITSLITGVGELFNAN